MKLFIAFLSALILQGCSTESPLQSSSQNPAIAIPTISADKATHIAILFAEDSGRLAPMYRLDLRPYEKGWIVEFIFIPESPDYQLAVRIRSDGAAEWFY